MGNIRLRFLALVYVAAFIVVLSRLFYWQVISQTKLQAIAQEQRSSSIRLPADRGLILASDGYPLVGNQPAYVLYAYTPDVNLSASEISQALAPIIADKPADILATPSAELEKILVEAMEATLSARLTNPESSWIPLKRQINLTQKKQIESLDLKGIGFDEYQVRLYPEASMAAQLLGFVGSDGTGNPKGYFGLEGKYNLELTGKSGILNQEKDALGRPISIGEFSDVATRDGRTIKTHIIRSVQLLAEEVLKEGIETYQAESGEVIIMEPHTGAVMAMASWPQYDPPKHKLYTSSLYKLPPIANTYEPGSIFKPLIMAAAINEAVITPESTCNQECAGPVEIGQYSIKTWNNQYQPGQTMTQVLERSDNTGMVYVGRLLGKDTLIEYLNLFGIGQYSGIDLESESVMPLRSQWGDIDHATATFGQGLAVNSIQILNAINAIASGGVLYQPQVVDQVIEAGDILDIEPKPIRRVISENSAAIMTQMMIASAEHGDAKWAIPKGYLIAGKTGTAQVAIEGHYDPDKTIASFVGFAPADKPAFTMLVKLNQPKASIWASETAAPMWFKLAKDLLVHLDIKPNQTINNQ